MGHNCFKIWYWIVIMNSFNGMLSKNHCLHVGSEYMSMPILPSKSPMISKYLETLNAVIGSALSDYGKVFAFRFDLRLPHAVQADAGAFENSVVSRFVESLKAKIRHNRMQAKASGALVHDSKVRYFWVREVGVCGRVHFHFAVLVNGHAYNWLGNYQSSRDNMSNRIREAWASALRVSLDEARPLVHFPENPSYIIFRDDQVSIAEFFRRASYLCKADTKCYGAGHHGYGASRS
jgi:hypothetical protein